jgi:DNA-binding transcriptional ArsR family regulator
VVLAKNLLSLFEQDERRVANTGSRRGSALQILARLPEMPYTSIGRLAESTGLSFNTVTASLDALKGLGIVSEVAGRRGRLFIYDEYLRLMDEGALAG